MARPDPQKTHSGPVVLGVTLGLILFIAFGVMGVALVTRRSPAPPPRPRGAPAPWVLPDAGARP